MGFVPNSRGNKAAANPRRARPIFKILGQAAELLTRMKMPVVINYCYY